MVINIDNLVDEINKKDASYVAIAAQEMDRSIKAYAEKLVNEGTLTIEMPGITKKRIAEKISQAYNAKNPASAYEIDWRHEDEKKYFLKITRKEEAQ